MEELATKNMMPPPCFTERKTTKKGFGTVAFGARYSWTTKLEDQQCKGPHLPYILVYLVHIWVRVHPCVILWTDTSMGKWLLLGYEILRYEI